MYIVVPLVVLILGQFAIIFRSCANVHAVFIPGAGCATTSIDSGIFAAMYVSYIVDVSLFTNGGSLKVHLYHGG